MANETSISDRLEAVAASGMSVKQKFDEIAEITYSSAGAKIMICELFGPRWSHIGGWKGAVVPESRVKIGPKYGIIAENIDPDSDLFQLLKRIILSIVSGRSN